MVANAANAAIEARKFDLAGLWIKRATGAMNDDSRVMRERERYLFHTGKYLESARLGYQVLQRLPKDRNASVYLGYALYNLGRYDDVLALTTRYENILPKESNFPLLTGHVHKQSQLLDQAADDYGRAIERDPKMVEAYVNRGYVENDLQQAQRAVGDFHQALEISPNNGIARLGLAFADLQLRRGKDALEQADAAQKLMGESGATHLARATAYRQMRSLANAEKEYRAALKYAPDEEKLHMALADTLYHERHYSQAIAALNDMMRLELEDRAQVYAEMAHNYAYLHRRDETMRYVKAAEEEDHNSSAILLDTGDALLTLGDHDAAMERFARALDAPDADRVQARLAIAKLFVRDGKWDDARQQVGLAFAEARVGEASPVTADDLVEAANIFLAIQDFDLAERYFAKARQAGASDEAAAVGLANAYLAQGNDRQAEAELGPGTRRHALRQAQPAPGARAETWRPHACRKGARPLDGPRRRGVARRRRHHRASAAALDAALHPPLQPGRIAGPRGPRGWRSARHAGWAGSPPPDPIPRSARPGGAGAQRARRLRGPPRSRCQR